MSKILTGSKAYILVNGKKIASFENITVTEAIGNQKPIEYKNTSLPNHICLGCGSHWMFSTDDSKCIQCGSTDIEHENNESN